MWKLMWYLPIVQLYGEKRRCKVPSKCTIVTNIQLLRDYSMWNWRKQTLVSSCNGSWKEDEELFSCIGSYNIIFILVALETMIECTIAMIFFLIVEVNFDILDSCSFYGYFVWISAGLALSTIIFFYQDCRFDWLMQGNKCRTYPPYVQYIVRLLENHAIFPRQSDENVPSWRRCVSCIRPLGNKNWQI